MEKIILGKWDGQPIWREKNSNDRMAEILAENKKNRLKVKSLSKENKIEVKHVT